MHASRPVLRMLLFGLLLAATTAATASSPVATWSSRFAAPVDRSAGSPMASRVLADGSAIVVADGGAFLTILRHDRAGNLLSSASVFSSSAYGRSVAIDAFGGVFVGETYQTSSGYEFEAMKYDGASGRRMWAAPVSIPADADTGAVPQYVFSTPWGDLLLVSPKSILLDGATGRVRWGPAGPAVASPIAVAFDREGGVAVSGTTLWTESEPPAYLTFKLSAESGLLEWGPARLGLARGPGTCPLICPDPRSVRNAVDSDGDVVVSVGSFLEFGDVEPGNEEWLIVKYRGDTGAVAWGPIEFDPTDSWEYEMPTVLAVDGEGDVVVGGVNIGSEGFTLLKYSGSTGEPRWGPVALASGSFWSVGGFALAGNGDPVVVGVSVADQNSWVATRINGRTGLVSWSQALTDDTGWGSPGGPLFFGDGTALVAGDASGSSDFGLRVIRFALSNGAGLWERRPQSEAGPRSAPVAHLVDGRGDSVVVGGALDVAGGGGGTVKYAGATGALLWGPVPFEEGARQWAFPSAAALDAHGDVFVIGTFSSEGTSSEWQVIKLSGTTGARIWGPVRTPSGGYEALALSADRRGDVVATGGSAAGWSTVKYRGADGGLLWQSSTPALSIYGSRVPAGVVADAAGDVVVAGILGEDQRDRAAVVKLDGATGAALWGPVFFEPYEPSSGQSNQFSFFGLDATGDILALGVSRDVGDSLGESFLVKFEGESGAVAWSQLVAPNAPYPTGFLLDPSSGDVFVRAAIFPDDAVWRYSGRDGARIWGLPDERGRLEPTEPRPPSGTGPLMVLDSEGSLVLAGTRFPDGALAVAYDPATGEARWGPVPLDSSGETGPAQMVSSPLGFVVTSNGSAPAMTTSYSLGLGIETQPEDVPPVACGEAFDFSLSAENGVAPYGWSLVSGALPLGLSLGNAGTLEGQPTATGHFPFRVRATDASGGSAERDLAVDVFDGGESLPISIVPDAFCTRLEAPEGYAAYEWLPGRQTARTIRACPTETVVFGVVATEASGCRRRGSVTVPAAVPAARGPIMPSERRALPREP